MGVAMCQTMLDQVGGDLSPAAGGGGVTLDRGDTEECFFR